MSDEIITQGFDEVKQVLQIWAGPGILRALRRGQRAALRPIAADARRFAPEGETGGLRRSHKVRAARRRRGRVTHRVTTSSQDVSNAQGVYYGGFQHWGYTAPDGTDIEGDPWLKQAADQNQASVGPIMARVMRTELEAVSV